MPMFESDYVGCNPICAEFGSKVFDRHLETVREAVSARGLPTPRSALYPKFQK
jgi:hypothetical protein